MYPVAEFLKEEMLISFGHVQRRDKDEDMRNILQMTVDGKRSQDLVKKDMARNQMTIEMAEDRPQWHVIIRADPLFIKCRGGKVRR